jgi:FHS family glucose/mannose:H+ symporter-like MFS transporter
MERRAAVDNPGADASGLGSLQVPLHVGFVLTGMVTTLLGPILPHLADRWALRDWQAGALFTAQFVGSTMGVLLSGALLPRRGFRFSLVAGFATMAAGVGALAAGPWLLGAASIWLYGIGLGLTIPAANLLVAESNRGRDAAALNVLNLAWGLGAVGWPYLASRLHATGLLSLAAGLALVAAGLAALPLASRESQPRAGPLSAATPGGTSAMLAFGLLFFVYVGTENSLGGWVAAYARRLAATPDAGWMLMPSLFWGGLLAGRAVAPALLRLLTEYALALCGLLLAALGTVLLLDADTVTRAASGVALAGLGLASVFPIVIALMSRAFGAGASRIAGGMFAVAGLGGATIPWLVGAVSTRFDSLRAGLSIPLFGSVAMAILLLLARRWTASREVSPSPPD